MLTSYPFSAWSLELELMPNGLDVTAFTTCTRTTSNHVPADSTSDSHCRHLKSVRSKTSLVQTNQAQRPTYSIPIPKHHRNWVPFATIITSSCSHELRGMATAFTPPPFRLPRTYFRATLRPLVLCPLASDRYL
jgi:hypothetical protein